MYHVSDISFLLNVDSESKFQRPRKGIGAEGRTRHSLSTRQRVLLVYIFYVIFRLLFEEFSHSDLCLLLWFI